MTAHLALMCPLFPNKCFRRFRLLFICAAPFVLLIDCGKPWLLGNSFSISAQKVSRDCSGENITVDWNVANFATNQRKFKDALSLWKFPCCLGGRKCIRLVAFDTWGFLPKSGTDDSCVIKVLFQLEHTLVKAGGRSVPPDTPFGTIPTSDGDKYHVRVVGVEHYDKVDLVIEYSMANIENMRTSQLDVFPKHIMDKVVYVPALQWSYFRSTSSPQSELPPRMYDVTISFSQVQKDRRNVAVEELRRSNVQVRSVSNVPTDSAEYQKVFEESKILLNVHQTDHHHTLEEFRVLPALLRGTVVISEDIPAKDTIPYHQFIIFAPYDRLTVTVAEVLANYETYFERVHGEFSSLSNILDTMDKKVRSDLSRALGTVSHLDECTM